MSTTSPNIAVEKPPVAQPLWRRVDRAQATRWIIALLCALYVLVLGAWAFNAGLDLRTSVWQSTRSIRFTGDVGSAYHWGNETLREAERDAHLPRFSDALAGQPPAILKSFGRNRDPNSFRRLSFSEVMQGIVHYMDLLQQENPDENYELDYPPMRLTVATFWVRHTQRLHPQIVNYPMQRSPDTSLKQPEDIAGPMLEFNTACSAVAAVAAFFLVWLWVYRSGKVRRRRAKPLLPPRPSRWIIPPGLLASMLATAGFWYALITLVPVPPRPTPMIQFTYIRPSADGKSAAVAATINSQNSLTKWNVEFGPGVVYTQITQPRFVAPTISDSPSIVRIAPLTPGQTVHCRIKAINLGGTTSTRDIAFNPSGPQLNFDEPAVGGLLWPNWTVWLRLLALFIAMVAAARMLPVEHRGWACGLIAAFLVWFNPTTLAVSDVWPQWDVWVLPFFLVAALAASLDLWLPAGMLLGFGCMFKGQLLLGGPVLILWPLLGGRIPAALRICIGMATGAAIALWPWMIQSAEASHWVEHVMVAAVIVLALARIRPFLWSLVKQAKQKTPKKIDRLLPLLLALGIACIAAAFVIMAGRLIREMLPTLAPPNDRYVLYLMLAILILPWVLTWRYIPAILALAFAGSVGLASLIYNGSTSWLHVGFMYGTVKHDYMQMSASSFANLTAILSHRYHWNLHDTVGHLHVVISWLHLDWTWLITTPDGQKVPPDLKTFLATIYGLCLVACAAAASLHARRNDPKILAALVAPWLIFPIIMCQMSDRYLLWFAAMSAVFVAFSTGMSLLGVLLTIIGAAMTTRRIMDPDPGRWPQLYDIVNKFYPGGGWLMVLLTLVVFVNALIPSRRGIAPED